MYVDQAIVAGIHYGYIKSTHMTEKYSETVMFVIGQELSTSISVIRFSNGIMELLFTANCENRSLQSFSRYLVEEFLKETNPEKVDEIMNNPILRVKLLREIEKAKDYLCSADISTHTMRMDFLNEEFDLKDTPHEYNDTGSMTKEQANDLLSRLVDNSILSLLDKVKSVSENKSDDKVDWIVDWMISFNNYFKKKTLILLMISI